MEKTGKHISHHRLTIWILIAMICGAGGGIAVNLFGELSGGHPVHAWLMHYGTDGVLQVAGQAFIRLLQALVVPLVFVSLACGTAALEDIRRLGRIGARTMMFYIGTTAVAISLAIVLALIFRPGAGFNLTPENDLAAQSAPSLVEVLINVFPRNIVEAMADASMLQVIVFAVLSGLAINMAGAPGKRMLAFLNDANAVIMKLVWIVMMVAPFGVFALIARTFASEGLSAFRPLLGYFLLVIAALVIQAMVTYPALLKLLSGLNPVTFMRKMWEVQLFAFSTASSNATIPVNLRNAEKRLGVDNSIASFTIPLGATINMDGTAIMQGVATVFIAQAYGIGLDLTDYLTVILTATLASIGTAGVPGVGLVMLSLVLTQAGLPVEGIALVFGIDRILDMLRTAVNITGDAAVSCIVAKAENGLDLDVFDSPIDTENAND